MRTQLVGPGVTAASAVPAVDGVLPAFELLDFIYSGTPRAGDYIANSIHGQGVVLGSPLVPLQGLDLALEGVVFEHNGEIVGTYTAAEVMGNPLNALAWLANHLAVRGQALKPWRYRHIRRHLEVATPQERRFDSRQVHASRLGRHQG